VKYGEYRIGGTSLASPLFAGLMALVEQKAGSAIGFANPLIYSKSGLGAFRDIVQPTQPAADTAAVRVDYVNGINPNAGYRNSIRRLGFDGGLTIKAAPGYDAVTGIGTPFGATFISLLSSP
jgi:subtilase family serine protease